MVTIVDRTGERQEVRYDQVPYTFGTKDKPKDQVVLPFEAATWLFRSQNPAHWVHTTAGEYVRRYGVVDAPEDWVADQGVDVLETSPLTRDTSRTEGWDAERRVVETVDLTKTTARPRTGDYVNQGAAARS